MGNVNRKLTRIVVGQVILWVVLSLLKVDAFTFAFIESAFSILALGYVLVAYETELKVLRSDIKVLQEVILNKDIEK